MAGIRCKNQQLLLLQRKVYQRSDDDGDYDRDHSLHEPLILVIVISVVDVSSQRPASATSMTDRHGTAERRLILVTLVPYQKPS